MKPLLYLTLSILILFPNKTTAHPSPNSLILLDIQSNGVAMELQLPISELEAALGKNVKLNTPELVEQWDKRLRDYLMQHITPLSISRQNWTIFVKDITLQALKKSELGDLQDLTVHLWMTPPTGTDSRYFTLNYDVIMHQVVTHKALITVRQDWESGIIAAHPVELGVIGVDISTNTIPSFKIDQTGGSIGKGFKSMVNLGMNHIAEGTDHLLFLLVLLLAAPLLTNGDKWGSYGGFRYSLLRLIKIITAFTIGHSITLLAGAMNWLRLPSQPIEILIAFSILISAIHAIRPIFSGKEAFVAAGFGLIHGLAFASTLSDLNLASSQMALSILGFNIGIELMQLVIMTLIIPSLIVLSKTEWYSVIRILGAIFAEIAAIAWIFERVLGKPNLITEVVAIIATYGIWVIGALFLMAIVSYIKSSQQL
jgi:hypothetical protein